MKRFFQNMSPFRVFLVMVLLISAITHSHERYCKAGHRHKAREAKVFGAGRVDPQLNHSVPKEIIVED
jgi:hypothetical protein